MTTALQATLPPLPDHDWQRILCVVAHPDDMEYGASAAVAHWVARGLEVHYLLLTAGEAGMQIPPAEAGPLRRAEQEKACAAVGVASLTILDFPDGMLTYGLDLRRAIARVIRQVRPDAVVTANFDVEAYGGLNQADHRATGMATVDAARDADNTWVFPELAESGLEKWHARALLVAGAANPTHAVVVDESDVTAAIASLRAHAAYLAALPGHPDPDPFLRGILGGGGAAAGCDYAATFQLFDLGGVAKSEE